MIDKVDIDLCFDGKKQSEVMETSVGAKWTAQAFNWPYYVIGTSSKEILIYSAFNSIYV
tara:strand:+ start:398 stop:574 length:177 start_codon:yes stop_codon:yes gene_type:complete